MQEIQIQKKEYSTPTLSTHGDVASTTQTIVEISEIQVLQWRPRQME
jgi:hypothetical protein